MQVMWSDFRAVANPSVLCHNFLNIPQTLPDVERPATYVFAKVEDFPCQIARGNASFTDQSVLNYYMYI